MREKKHVWRAYCSAAASISGTSQIHEHRHLKLLIKQGKLDDALHMLDSLNSTHLTGNDYIYVRLIQLCISLKAFVKGMYVHDHIARHDFEPNNILWNALVNLYGKCGCLSDARQMFDSMPHRDVFSWTIMIEAYAKHEASEDALSLFVTMETNGIQPDEICFLSVLKACGGLRTLRQGMNVHACIIMYGFELNVLVNSSLLDMYSKCGSLDDAFHAFLHMPNRDIVVWNLMISGYADCSDRWKAFELLKLMQQEGVICNGFTFFCILQACGMAGLNQCQHIHVWALHCGVELNLCFFNSLINLYCKYGALLEAQEVFDRVPNPEIVTWNTMLSGYIQHGHFERALLTLKKMVIERVKPDSITVATALKACTSIEALKEGMEIHKYVYICGMELDRFVASTLIDFYGRCGELENAYNVFNKIPHKDVVCWNSMVSVFVKHECAERAFKLFTRMMVVEGVKADEATFTCVLKACAHLGDGERGKCVHNLVIESGVHLNTEVGNTILDMYAKCNSLHDACTMFKRLEKHDLVTWNAMIAGYAQHKHIEGALDIFEQMQCKGIAPDKVTFLSILKACTNSGKYDIGREIHAFIDKAGFSSDIFLGNALIDMYAKCGRMDMSVDVFRELCDRDIVSWNALITGYSQHGHGQEVYDSFLEMLQEGVEPNEVTFITVLKACSDLVTIDYGKQIHVIVRETLYGCDAFVRSTLLDMYAKCGSIMDASNLFENLMDQDMVSCNVMIAGYAQHGFFNEASVVFHRMHSRGGRLDHITYISIICACNYIGLVLEGCSYFMCMRDNGITPSIESYGCLVDLISRAGQLDVALYVVENIQCEPNIDIWMSLLSACKFCNNVNLATCAAEYVLELERENTAAILLLSNMVI